MPTPVGIDLGTTTCEVAFVDAAANNRLKFVPFPGNLPNVARSAVLFDEAAGRIVVGYDAYTMRVPRVREVVLNIKRHMGEAEYPPEARLPRTFAGQAYGPPEISGEILKYLKTEAERFTGEEIRQAVITVPAKFETLAREHTEKAADIAGLETLMLLPEPVAAMVGYPGPRPAGECVAMVYDFGGGTFDCTIVRAEGRRYQVLAKAGERHLGGSHIDEMIGAQLIEPRVREAGFDLASEEEWALRIRQKILDAAETAKIELASEQRESAWVSLPHLEAPGKSRATVRVEIRQQELETLIAPLLRAANEQMAKALEDAGLSRDDLDMVILVGGSTRLPAIRNAVRAFMGERAYDEREKGPARRKVLADGAPELLVARGAAIVAASHGKGEGIELVDILLRRVGVREPGSDRFRPLFAKGTDIEAAQRDMVVGWSSGDSIALDLYEGDGERCTDQQNKYVGTIRVGPARLAPRTPVVISVRYRTDTALPEVSARLSQGGAPLPTQMLFEQGKLETAGGATIQAAREWDLAFCLDTTGSMQRGPYLSGFLTHCLEFVRSLSKAGEGVDVRLAAVGFGDRTGGEAERVYSFTPNRDLFATRLTQLEYHDGGDEPESALDALQAAERLAFRTGDDVQRRIIIVTDAPPRPLESGSLERLVAGLASKGVRVSVVGPHCAEYDMVVERTQGQLYDLLVHDGDEWAVALFGDLRKSILPPEPPAPAGGGEPLPPGTGGSGAPPAGRPGGSGIPPTPGHRGSGIPPAPTHRGSGIPLAPGSGIPRAGGSGIPPTGRKGGYAAVGAGAPLGRKRSGYEEAPPGTGLEGSPVHGAFLGSPAALAPGDVPPAGGPPDAGVPPGRKRPGYQETPPGRGLGNDRDGWSAGNHGGGWTAGNHGGGWTAGNHGGGRPAGNPERVRQHSPGFRTLGVSASGQIRNPEGVRQDRERLGVTPSGSADSAALAHPGRCPGLCCPTPSGSPTLGSPVHGAFLGSPAALAPGAPAGDGHPGGS